MEKNEKNTQPPDSNTVTDSERPLRTDKLLIKEGFLKKEDVLKALSVQKLDKDDTDTHEEDIDFMELNLDEEIEGKDGEGPVCGVQDIEAEELVNFILNYGITNGASDIHIEQDRKGAKLRYRLEGVMREINIEWLKKKVREKAGSIISRIKVMSNLDIAEKRLPQDGV